MAEEIGKKGHLKAVRIVFTNLSLHFLIYFLLLMQYYYNIFWLLMILHCHAQDFTSLNYSDFRLFIYQFKNEYIILLRNKVIVSDFYSLYGLQAKLPGADKTPSRRLLQITGMLFDQIVFIQTFLSLPFSFYASFGGEKWEGFV